MENAARCVSLHDSGAMFQVEAVVAITVDETAVAGEAGMTDIMGKVA